MKIHHRLLLKRCGQPVREARRMKRAIWALLCVGVWGCAEEKKPSAPTTEGKILWPPPTPTTQPAEDVSSKPRWTPEQLARFKKMDEDFESNKKGAEEMGDVLSAYRRNELFGDDLYKGKRIKIIAKVNRVSSIFGEPLVEVSSSRWYDKDESSSATLFFSKEDAYRLTHLSPGYVLIAEGTCQGHAVFSVAFKDCRFIDSKYQKNDE